MGPSRTLLPARTAVFGGAYLALLVLFVAAERGMGVYRSLALAGVLALTVGAWLADALRPNPSALGAQRRSAVLASTMLLGLALVPLLDAVLSLHGPHRIRVLGDLVDAAVICAVALALWPGRAGATRVIAVALLVAAIIPATNLVSGVMVPKLHDIATTTADAIAAVWSGRNPYAIATLDPLAMERINDPAFGGFKYLPLMLLAYAPSVAALGQIGILWENVLLYAATIAASAALARRLAAPARSPVTALFAAVLLVASFVVASESLAMGTNDLASVLPVLAAVLLWPRRPALCGLLIGISLCMKPMPAIVAATLLLPARRRDWLPYCAAIVVGMLPALPFFVWNPRAFLDNIVVFSLIRPPDSTTWREGAPAWLGAAASVAGLAVWAGLTAWCLRVGADLRTRLLAFVVGVLCILLAGPSDHDNYVIWWAPVLVALLSTVRPERAAAAVALSSRA